MADTPDPVVKMADAIAAGPTVHSLDDYDLGRVQVDEQAASTSLGYYLALAFVGGPILNLMPCVLPVLFLKAMSMQRRSWQYVAGVLSVFFTYSTMFSASSGVAKPTVPMATDLPAEFITLNRHPSLAL